jgi:hypothetical protein
MIVHKSDEISRMVSKAFSIYYVPCCSNFTFLMIQSIVRLELEGISNRVKLHLPQRMELIIFIERAKA